MKKKMVRKKKNIKKKPSINSNCRLLTVNIPRNLIFNVLVFRLNFVNYTTNFKPKSLLWLTMKTKISFFKDFSRKLKAGKKQKDHVSTVTVIIFGLVPILFIIYLLLGPIIKVVQKDLNATTMYIISDNLNLRSDRSSNAYVIGNYDYGTQVKVYQTFDNKWAEVAVGRKKGYMSLEYLVSPEIFYLIDGMFGNDLAKKVINKTIYKKAIANYLLQNGYVSDVPDEIKVELYGRKGKNKPVWQIFVLPGNPRYNSYCYGDFNGDKKQDAAFIITNKKTKQNRLIILNINKVGLDYGSTLFSMDMKDNWYYIRLAPKGTKYYIGNEKKRLPIDGILIGSNRDPALHDPVRLLLYDGQHFRIYPQQVKE